EDLWHPSAPVALSWQGVEMFLCPCASPGRGVMRGAALGSERSYDHMTRTYAQLFTSYLVFCNRIGYEDGIAFWGGSRVIGPDGALIGEAAGSNEALIFHRLDLAAVRRSRIHNPLLRDERHDINAAQANRLWRRPARD
ncbi:MAG TPA: nitrilase-related carbon-nitrogen hydrolase, partial [Candidatus Sulfotelmatobacter sp.]|nr:nitrilase-related carbon-nitrogen hydrolase [Candidatus Sulfotelmatobacter sp.]